MKDKYNDIEQVLRKSYDDDYLPTDSFLEHVEAVMRATAEATSLPEKDSPHHAGAHAARRRVLGVAIAATVTMLLGVTAYAVYQARIQDYQLPENTTTVDIVSGETSIATTSPASRVSLSLVGYQGTPEYEAFLEWETLQERWWEEKATIRQENNQDDSWHETPDNYCFYYSAVTQSQARELDTIMKKYGLTPHEHRSTLLREDRYTTLGLESLCQLLDMEPFIYGEWDAYSGYVYDDGTFKLHGSKNTEDWDEYMASGFTMFLSVKGSFTTIFAHLPADYDQWNYTVGGQELTLALSNEGGIILAETPGAYIYLSDHSQSREDLEAFADAVDFDALAEKFDGTPLDLTEGMKEMDEKYAAWEDDYMTRHNPAPEDAASLPSFDSEEEEKTWILAQLGDLDWPAEGPDGYGFLWQQTICQRDGYRQRDGQDVAVYALYSSSYYSREADNSGLSLIYKRVFSDPALTKSVNQWELDSWRQIYPESVELDLCGHEALYIPEDMNGPQSTLCWLDQERDLFFQLCVPGEKEPLETLRGYAEELISVMDGTS